MSHLSLSLACCCNSRSSLLLKDQLTGLKLLFLQLSSDCTQHSTHHVKYPGTYHVKTEITWCMHGLDSERLQAYEFLNNQQGQDAYSLWGLETLCHSYSAKLRMDQCSWCCSRPLQQHCLLVSPACTALTPVTGPTVTKRGRTHQP